MSTRALVESFHDWSAQYEALVLATVIETQGSTYSKAGTQLLMRTDGQHAGLVSGGCLEGDLAEHARKVLDTGEATVVTYDMRDDADDLWGIGLGCNGLMKLLLQKITAAEDWQPFNNIAAALADNRPHRIALTTGTDQTGHCSIDTDTVAADIFSWTTRPWIRLLILGGAPDAEPVVRLARDLGWAVTVADHREHYLQANDFSRADQLCQVMPGSLTSQLNMDDFNAIVIMSHHLETDRKYLAEVVDSQAGYIGLLGPAARKAKLLEGIGEQGVTLATRLHGPVGLDIGADSPESIALSLLSEIQSVLTKTQP